MTSPTPEYQRAWRKANPERVRAYTAKFKERAKANRKHRPRTDEDRLKDGARYRAARRLILVEKLGGKCLHCGFSDPRALQIDHVNGGGKQELAALPWTAYHRKVLADTEGNYQLLCANCNWIKRHENKENGDYRCQTRNPKQSH